MRHSIHLTGLAGLVLLQAACGNATPQAAAGQLAGRLVVTGSSTCAPLVSDIAKRFEGLHPAVRIDVQTGGSSRGIADVTRSIADIGMVSRDLKPSEAAGLMPFVFALDGVAIILHANNPIRELVDDHVKGIYTGAISNWSQVGGPDAPITVVHKASGRATLEVFLKYFGLKESSIQADVVIGDNQHGIITVAGNPHAIGYVSVGAAEYEIGQRTQIRLLDTAGIPATTANVHAGKFPIGRPLILLTRRNTPELARHFIDYCRSEAVHDLVQDLYYAPVSAE